jgi:BirA family biotin operon repressor/biotin-[acetyl-CoA-carboxylase] ligase
VPALDRVRLEAAIAPPWTRVQVVDETGSTNADLITSAPTLADGTVLVAEHQHAGRGRLDRSWTSPARSGLTFSVLVRPGSAPSTWGWLALLTGVAARDAVVEMTGLDALLKWPNDLLICGRKAGGILAQVAGDAVVIGIGLNVTASPEDLPDTATSLAREGASSIDRTALLIAVLRELGTRYRQWDAAGGDAASSGIADDYRERCATIGRRVAVDGTDGTSFEATATGVDADGRLVLGTRVVAAGDVRHLRQRD